MGARPGSIHTRAGTITFPTNSYLNPDGRCGPPEWRSTDDYAGSVRVSSLLPVLFAITSSAPVAHALTVRVTAQALERTLQRQLFKGPGDRYYLRGHADGGCYVYASDPHVTFEGQRVLVQVSTHARLGTSIHGQCLGVGLGLSAGVSLLPEAEGESIGFRDARIEGLGGTKELDAFLEPFLSRKLPQQFKVNANDLLRQLLSTSAQTTGYDFSLQTLTIHSMQVQSDTLVIDFDGELDVR